MTTRSHSRPPPQAPPAAAIASEIQALQLKRTEELRREVSGIAHDLNNLLLAIGASAGNLRREYRCAPMIDDRLAAIEDGAMRCGDLCCRLLTLARQDPPRRERCDLTGAVLGIAELARWLLPEDASLELDTPKTEVPVELDRTQFVRLVNNLVSNAARALPARGTVILRVIRDDAAGVARFEVQDDGQGIPASILRKVFEPYFTTAHEGGTGIGLTVVQAIARDHEGHVEIESIRGVGTTVRVTLPLADVSPEKPPSEHPTC